MQDNQNFKKVVLIGDQFVGKRSLLNKAFKVSKRASPLYVPIDFVKLEKGTLKVHFYDSLFRNTNINIQGNNLAEPYYAEIIPNAHAILLCYACDDPVSLRNLLEWSQIVKKFRTPNTKIYLVGTKCDSISRCDESMYENVRATLGSIHGGFKTSSVTGSNVENLFAHVFYITKPQAQLNDVDFKSGMLPAQKINSSESDKRRNSLNISITTPKGTVTSYKNIPSNEEKPLQEMIRPSRSKSRLRIFDNDISILSCRQDFREDFMQPEMSYTEGRGMFRVFAPQEVRGKCNDTYDSSLAYEGNSLSYLKPNLNSINGLTNKKSVQKRIVEDFTELDSYENEPKQNKSKCRYILEDNICLYNNKLFSMNR